MPILDNVGSTDVTQQILQAQQSSQILSTEQELIVKESFTLSVVMIVKDEEEYIGRCLDSLQILGYEELIIVDTGCTDRTVEIAQKYPNVKIYEFEWVHDFSAARNFSIAQATQEWCMWIDADMYFLKEDALNLRNILRNRLYQAQHNAFSLMLRNVDTDDGWNLARLWRRSEGFLFECPVHEILSPMPDKPDGMRLISLDVTLQHDRDGHVGGLEYHDLLLKWLEDKPEDQRALFYMAKHCHLMATQAELPEAAEKLYDEALRYYDRAAQKGRDSGVYLNAGNIYYERQKWEEALQYAFKAMETDCTYAEPFILAANCYDEIGNMANAIAMYKVAKHMERPFHATKATSQAMYDYVPCINLAQCYLKVSAIDSAIDAYMEALRTAVDDQMRETAISGLRYIYQSFTKMPLPTS